MKSTTSSVKNYPKFLTSTNKSSSKEKLYLNTPKNINNNFINNATDKLVKSPSLKISSKMDSQGKILIYYRK